MSDKSLLDYVVKESGTPGPSTTRVIEMLDQDMTIPFIARYRKEMTGGMDEVALEKIRDNLVYARELEKRRATVLETISGQEKLTPELESRIKATWSKTELEDLYLPYKPKRRTRASIAREKGLEPLAELLQNPQTAGTPEELAQAFISPEKGVEDTEAAWKGAADILAEGFSERADLRRLIREDVWKNGVLAVKVTDDFKEKRTKFEQYYDYTEPVKNLPSHRVLAIRRGEREEVLRSRITADPAELAVRFRHICIPDPHPRGDFLYAALEDALKRLVLPSVETDIQMELKQTADEEAIQVFAANLRELLMAPPAGDVCTLGVDPGFRTGCKLAVLDSTGKLVEHATIYPTPPRNAVDAARKEALRLISAHGVRFVAVGNGTASRETMKFFSEIVPAEVTVTQVSEAGASVYSASAAGREEFPDHDVTVRGAVSIGRRFQDPLSELVKIEPKSIGVGQYQHDVSQARLKERLDRVVESVVNAVGVELNTASSHLLRYVSGIGPTLARNIVARRDETGPFKKREELLNVRMFGDKAFQQGSGFLRIRGGEEPLDATAIHPESYGLARRICDAAGHTAVELAGRAGALKDLKAEAFVDDTCGLPTIQDVMRELVTPGRDPRKAFEVFEYAEGVNEISDLEAGMDLPGMVTNVTRFGAFVDIGVHQDGLVHVSELAHKFVEKPEDVVAVGQVVRVRVLSVDAEMKRIQLSIKALLEPPPRKRPGGGGKPRRKKPDPEKKRRDQIDDLKRKWGAR